MKNKEIEVIADFWQFLGYGRKEAIKKAKKEYFKFKGDRDERSRKIDRGMQQSS